MRIFFENCANFITAAKDDGEIVIRCGFRLTDCGDDESLDAFVARHGGAESTALYLKDCYASR